MVILKQPKSSYICDSVRHLCSLGSYAVKLAAVTSFGSPKETQVLTQDFKQSALPPGSLQNFNKFML